MTNQKPIELPAWAVGTTTDGYGTYVLVDLAGVQFRMRWIEPGTFMMGSPNDEPGRYDNETRHQVTLTRGYWMAETQCTQELWQAVMGKNPSRFECNQHPVESVSWDDCQQFIRRTNELAPGLDLRLPTEAEWECACRAGTTGACYGELDDVAWHHGNSERSTHPVGQKLPNAWGLYDMLGNVWEWCADWYDYYPEGPVTDPMGTEHGGYRVLRGGCWFSDARYVRSALRLANPPGARYSRVGARFARGPNQEEPNGERRESRRADAGGESGVKGEAIELPEGWERCDCDEAVFWREDEVAAIEEIKDSEATVSIRTSVRRGVPNYKSVYIPDAVLAAYLQTKGWDVRKL